MDGLKAIGNLGVRVKSGMLTGVEEVLVVIISATCERESGVFGGWTYWTDSAAFEGEGTECEDVGGEAGLKEFAFVVWDRGRVVGGHGEKLFRA